MKILHITPSYKPAYIYGGTIESVARLCEAQAQAGEDVTVFTTTANGKNELDVKAGEAYFTNGVKVFYFKRQTKDHSHVSFNLWKRLNKEYKQYDVVHIHSWWNVLVIGAAVICKRKKIKTVLSPRGMLSDYIIKHSNTSAKYWMHSLAGKFLLQSTFLHATSEAELAECKKLIPGWKGIVIPNIIFLPELEILKKRNHPFSILFLSRIHPKKGIELLMEAISKLKTSVCLLIAGTGEEKYIESLKLKAESLHIKDKIMWLGWKDREEKFEVLMQADMFALTSYNENFANVVIESLHAGTPVLLSAEVGLSKFVVEHDLGWVCSLKPEDIAEKIEIAITEVEKRKRINNCGSAIIRKYFSAETLIPQYLQLYTS